MEEIIKNLKQLRFNCESYYGLGEFLGAVDQVEAILYNISGSTNKFEKKIREIVQYFQTETEYLHRRKRTLGLIDLALNEIEFAKINWNNPNETPKREPSDLKTLTLKDNKNIFIVHGHNEVMKQNVARIIEKINLNPIILHEQPNKGLTIIEKFLANSDVSFAIVLLSADDIGYSKNEVASKAKERARQNVIFELGFFTAKLGRKRVIALVENSENFETPSDISGVIYIPFDGVDGKFKFALVKEMIDSGYEIDIKKIV